MIFCRHVRTELYIYIYIYIYSPGKKSWEQRQNRSFDFNLATISASHVHISALFIHYMLQPSYLTRLATCISDIANFSAK